MNEETKAADLAQRVAELEQERNTTAAHVAMIARQLGDEALQVDDIAVRVLALVADHDAAQQARRDAQALAERYQAERNAAGVQARREVAEQVRALTAERDELRNELDCAEEAADVAACSLVSEDCAGYECVGSYIRAVTQQLAKERDELRTKHDELLTALHGIGRALGLAEAARSPYLITCGVLERVNKLAELERQGPVAWSYGDWFWSERGSIPAPIAGSESPLYARPVPAQPASEPAPQPVAWVLRSTAKSSHPIVVTHRRHLSEAFCDLVEVGIDHLDPLYARPVPAIPEGWRLVNAGALAMVVNALRRDAEEGRPVRGEMADELIAAAPEYKE